MGEWGDRLSMWGRYLTADGFGLGLAIAQGMAQLHSRLLESIEFCMIQSKSSIFPSS